MKKLLCLTLFLSAMIYCYSIKTEEAKKTSNLKTNEKITKQSDTDLTKGIFLTPPQKCASKADLKKDVQNALVAKKQEKQKQYLRADKSDLWWIKNWGYGDSAYLFDYVSPVFKTTFVTEAQEIYDKFKALDNKKDGPYEDPFDYNNFISEDMTEDEKKKLLGNLKLINDNYDPDIFNISVNAVQLHSGMKAFKWYDPGNGVADYSKDFLVKYDADGDGRLNPRELILGTIDYNKDGKFGDPNIKNLFNKSARSLDAMFQFIDCDNDGYINSEELWKNVKALNRGTGEKRYDIYGLNQTLRLRAINDFILKSHSSKNGLLSRDEFISGVFLGFWNRQCERKKILTDDSRSLIALRWDKDGTIDKAYIKSLAR